MRKTMTAAAVAGSSLTAALLGGGCRPKNEFIPPPPPPVTVQAPVQRDVTVFKEFAGRTSAIQSVEIRARVRGILQAVHVDDGQTVRQGDALFTIEPDSYRAAVQAAEAALAKARAARQLADVTYERIGKAYQTKAVSEIDLLTAEAEKNAAAADVLAAEAMLTQAQIDLSYTIIKAPARGVMGRTLVDAGNLVGGTPSTLLATLTVLDPIHVYFNVAERTVLPLLAARENADERHPPMAVLLKLADGSHYSETGRVDFVDTTIDADTGTATVRAEFPNPAGRLLPGLYGQILVPEVKPGALLVPGSAIQRDLSSTLVMVVDDRDTVQRRVVVPGARVGDLRIVEEGLEPGERVIVRGLQRARPGIKVAPEDAAAPPAAAPVPAANDQSGEG